MREIKYIVLHCTATSQSATVGAIVKYWKEQLKWQNPGYHFIVKSNGEIVQLQPIDKPSNGVKGFNANSIHISYIGGQYNDDRTKEQRIAMEGLIKALHGVYPKAVIQGHRDFPNVHKACPNFEVSDWLTEIGL